MRKTLVIAVLAGVCLALAPLAADAFGVPKLPGQPQVSPPSGGGAAPVAGGGCWDDITNYIKGYCAKSLKFSEFDKHKSEYSAKMDKCYDKQWNKSSGADGNYVEKKLQCGKWCPDKNNCRFSWITCYSYDDSCQCGIENTSGYGGQAGCPPQVD